MTITQISSILGAGNLDSVKPLHIDKIIYIAFKKDRSSLKVDISNIRFRFDTINSILEVTYVRPFKKNFNLPENLPPHGNYDILTHNGVSWVFEYMTDNTGKQVIDYYSLDSIATFGLKE